MDYLDDASIISNLKKRFQTHLIYVSFLSSVLQHFHESLLQCQNQIHCGFRNQRIDFDNFSMFPDIRVECSDCYKSLRKFITTSTFFLWTLDLFHNKSKGLFTLLNDECALQRPSVENFKNMLKIAWQRDVAAPISWVIRQKNSNEDVFLIRHFTDNVIYSSVDQLIFLVVPV